MMLEEVKAEIRDLPEIYRRVVELRHFCGYTYAEVSEALDLPEGTVTEETQLFARGRC